MEVDVNISKSQARTIAEEPLMSISGGSYTNNNRHNNNNNHRNNNNHNNNNNNNGGSSNNNNNNNNGNCQGTTTSIDTRQRTGCCGILSRLLCLKRNTGKTANSSSDYNNFENSASCFSILPQAAMTTKTAARRKTPHRRTPQEIYLESRGKSCKKLLKFNGHSNKILLYPEEGWARTASSSYWTITPCWWQPNRYRIEEFSGTQRHSTKAKMLPLEQQGSLLISGQFPNKKSVTTNNLASVHTIAGSRSSSMQTAANTPIRPNEKVASTDEFKLYLSSNITMEDYNMGYCLTGFVERRCQQTNSFQMTHFAVIKRQWPSIGNNSNYTKST